MTGTRIEATELPIEKILSDDFRFRMPRYQRPYVWEAEQATELLDDLLAASAGPESLQVLDPYFLGSIVLVKDSRSPDADVVDGQQRLTTLTILLCVLRDLLSDDLSASLHDLIFQKGNAIRGIEDAARMNLRDLDQAFFAKHVQSLGATAHLETVSRLDGPDSQRLLVGNALTMRHRLQDVDPERLLRLAQYITRFTFLVVVSTQNLESAFRIFSVLNERGLELTAADILKAEIIGEIPEADQAGYTQAWDNIEVGLGRDGFNGLFSHLRMVFARTKARRAITREFREAVISRFPDGRRLVDDVLVPYARAYQIVSRAEYSLALGATSTDDVEAVNALLRAMEPIPNADWVPVAMSLVRRLESEPAELRRALSDLDRLAASMLLRRIDLTRRIERYGRVLTDVEEGADLFADGSTLQLDPDERSATAELLDDEIYTHAKAVKYVLLRLDSTLASGAVTYDYKKVSVEHVLPQHPRDDAVWRTWFTDPERRYWVHRLANLVLLSGSKNAMAGRYDFDVKKDRYFSTRLGICEFPLTTQVLRHQTWTPDELARRQGELVSHLATLWRLT